MPDLAEARERLDRFVAQRMAADGTPGLALALTDREHLLQVATYGFADLAARAPVRPETLFEIGSIGKSFLAVILLQLAEAGAVDLDAPVTRYLPWFQVRSAHGPITLHHLLTHTTGIIAGTDFTPDARYEVWVLRETETGGPPGERFHYSNVGFKALGLVVSAVTGRPFPDVLQERVLDPLGMTASTSTITHQIRPRLAVGYRQLADDLPRRRDLPLAPATWLETDSADGSIASTPADLTRFLRMLLNRGQAPGAPLVRPESFERMTRPMVPIGPDAGYGYGIVSSTADGRPRLGHSGGMVGYAASMIGDVEAGLGAVAFVNGPGRPGAVVGFALDLLVAVHEGRPLPEVPDEIDPVAVADTGAYAGAYRTPGRTLRVVAEGNRLTLVLPGGERVPLERSGDDTFAVPHLDFARFPLRFEREGDRVVGAWHGGDWYAGDADSAPATVGPPATWHAYVGHYRSHNPWATNFRVVLRGVGLWLLSPGADLDGVDDEEPLVPLGEPTDGQFRIGADEASPERLRFDTIVEGQALRANLSGGEYFRFFTP